MSWVRGLFTGAEGAAARAALLLGAAEAGGLSGSRSRLFSVASMSSRTALECSRRLLIANGEIGEGAAPSARARAGSASPAPPAPGSGPGPSSALAALSVPGSAAAAARRAPQLAQNLPGPMSAALHFGQ